MLLIFLFLLLCSPLFNLFLFLYVYLPQSFIVFFAYYDCCIVFHDIYLSLTHFFVMPPTILQTVLQCSGHQPVVWLATAASENVSNMFPCRTVCEFVPNTYLEHYSWVIEMAFPMKTQHMIVLQSSLLDMHVDSFLHVLENNFLCCNLIVNLSYTITLEKIRKLINNLLYRRVKFLLWQLEF